MEGAALLSLQNPVFRSYAFYAAVLILKMFVVTFQIALQRFSLKVSVTNVVVRDWLFWFQRLLQPIKTHPLVEVLCNDGLNNDMAMLMATHLDSYFRT